VVIGLPTVGGGGCFYCNAWGVRTAEGSFVVACCSLLVRRCSFVVRRSSFSERSELGDLASFCIRGRQWCWVRFVRTGAGRDLASFCIRGAAVALGSFRKKWGDGDLASFCLHAGRARKFIS